MIVYLVRAAKRFAVLIPGIVIAYVSVHDIFPLFDKRLPLAAAVFLTYVLGAYVLIPALIRLVRIVVPARHLQSYCVTPDGFASDPVNIGIIGSKKALIAAMQAAGWSVADSHSLRNVAHEVISVLLNHPYPTAPMSNLYLFGRKHDIGFEIQIEAERGHRHHVRFWATTYRGGGTKQFGTMDWHKRRRKAAGAGTLWVGAASQDIGFAFIRHNVQLTHMIHSDTNAERTLIVRGLKNAGLIASAESIRLRRPYKLTNRAWRGSLHTDGTMEIAKLTDQ